MAPKTTSKKQDKEKANEPKGLEEADYLDKVDPILVKNIHELTGGRSNLRIFVPLCGKTRDMLRLADQGHAIVGVELSEIYIKGFFRDTKLEYTVSSEQITAKTKTDVYTAKGKDIKVYRSDIFDFNAEAAGGQFDGIWDQSAMPVINDMGEKKLKQYTSLMQSLLAPGGRHMVEVCKHGANFVTEEKLKLLYGDKGEVRFIGTRMYQHEEDSDDERVWAESHGAQEHEGHGHESHGHEEHEDDYGALEMFYYIITFKEREEPRVLRKRKSQQQEEAEKPKEKKAGGKQGQKKKGKK